MRQHTCIALAAALLSGLCFSTPADNLEQGWSDPPLPGRIRAYWWWLNGNVTKAAITRDLEEMRAKGFGGALICDADGASQDGNDRVPHGPDFLSDAWRDLYRHTLREADRLGLEMSLNIQSGWNLGGPMVSAEDAAKKLVFSETRAQGPGPFSGVLPKPPVRDGYYRDLFVIGCRVKADATAITAQPFIRASSAQTAHEASAAFDGKADTFWVSQGGNPGEGPAANRPEWLQFEFTEPVAAHAVTVTARPGYGPRAGALQVGEGNNSYRTLQTFSVTNQDVVRIAFPETTAKQFRLLILDSHDPRHPQSPRNVQVAEVSLSGPRGTWPSSAVGRRPILNWQQKGMHRALSFSAPDTTPLFEELPSQPGEEDATEVVDLTARLDAQGHLKWDMPEGRWEILRFGCTIGDHAKVSTSSDGWKGFALDVLDLGALERYWKAVVEPLIQDAGPLAGKALKYLHTDSWEVEAVNWTPTLREEFRKRRGYDLVPWLPALTGRIVQSRPLSNRFLHDFRKTLGDLAIDHHFRFFRNAAHRHGLLIHPESGGPHAVPIDAQRCLGWNDVPMSEFWAWSWRHRVGDMNRFFCKQPASAAHTYGRRLVAAEGFTTIGPHWQETIWDNLKPSFDQALTEGMNLLFWHAFVCSPAEMGMPGIQYFAGTHFNPNTTWWAKSGPFLTYMNRCQFLLQQGLFAADVAYYYGDHVPNFAQLKRSDPAGVLPGYDYDVLTEEALLERMRFESGRFVLPDGMSYRVLVLPNRPVISLAALRKIGVFVKAGAPIIASARPVSPASLNGYPACDTEFNQLAGELWRDAGPDSNASTQLKHGVISGKTAREWLVGAGIQPDFEYVSASTNATLDFIHRRQGNSEIYFVANRSNAWIEAETRFRVEGKTPELWDPVTGERRPARAWSQEKGRIKVPMQLPPYGSMFVVFRSPAGSGVPAGGSNHLAVQPVQQLEGPWSVRFDPRWGGPAQVEFATLESWTKHAEPGVKFYSGTATYERTFSIQAGAIRPGQRLWLDLGAVRELAQVQVNGKDCGIVWAPPFRADITGAVKAGENRLQVEVVNFWPNRIIGDASLPAEKRLTRTNVRKLTPETPLMTSGLLGPVQVLSSAAAE